MQPQRARRPRGRPALRRAAPAGGAGPSAGEPAAGAAARRAARRARPQAPQAMQLELKRIQREVGITFVFVTHDQEEALAMSDRMAVIDHGRIEQIGTPAEIYDSRRPVRRRIRRHVQRPPGRALRRHWARGDTPRDAGWSHPRPRSMVRTTPQPAWCEAPSTSAPPPGSSSSSTAVGAPRVNSTRSPPPSSSTRTRVAVPR